MRIVDLGSDYQHAVPCSYSSVKVFCSESSGNVDPEICYVMFIVVIADLIQFCMHQSVHVLI